MPSNNEIFHSRPTFCVCEANAVEHPNPFKYLSARWAPHLATDEFPEFVWPDAFQAQETLDSYRGCCFLFWLIYLHNHLLVHQFQLNVEFRTRFPCPRRQTRRPVSPVFITRAQKIRV
jgi:hypothetical protein